MDNMLEEAMDLQHRLETLRAEHRELDEAIARIYTAPDEDELLVRRLKKRKLVIKDRISLIEQMLQPETQA